MKPKSKLHSGPKKLLLPPLLIICASFGVVTVRAQSLPTIQVNNGAAAVAAENRVENSVTGSQGKTLTYARSWETDAGQPELTRFRSWTSRYLGSVDAKAKQSLIAEGRQLARQRRAAFAKLIKSDPARALASTVPAAMRKKLPREILLELETRVSGMGDYLPMAVDRARGGPPVEPVQRFVRLNNQTYRAYVYGRRTWQMTKFGIPLHGVAVDGLLALAETSLRELEPGEASETTEGIVTLHNRAATKAAPVLAEMGGTIYRFVSRQHLLEVEGNLEAAEAGIGPKPRESARKILELGLNAPQQETQAAPNSWTTGNKQFLVIRVDFSDLQGDPVGPWWNPTTYTAPVAQDYLDTQVSPFYAATSYGLTSLTNTATPQLYRMPQTAEYYATADNGGGLLIADAETAASADYDISGYDRIAVLSSFLGDIPGSQLGASTAGIGGPTIHISGDMTAVAHELGHTYGLFHANLWQVDDGNPISPSGTNFEYGDDFDVMGYAFDLRGHFNPWFKNLLGWIADNQVQSVTADGVYRIHRFDTSTPAAGALALKIPRDVTRDYWVGCRRNYTDNPSMQDGAYIIWGYHEPHNSHLLDMINPGNRTIDCGGPLCDPDVALPVGSTFTDPDEGISIEVLDEGGSGDAQYIDIRVTLRSTAFIRVPLNTDPAWTREGEWAFGMPSGQGGTMYGYPDPTSGATGANVFGVNLNGDWSANAGVPYYLTAGPFNFTGYTHTKLRFARWLNTDYPACAYATIEVSSDGANWTTVWENQYPEITDSSWTQVLYDISAVADNQPTVFVRWGYQANCEFYPFSGWNIDDVEFIAVPPPIFSSSLDLDPGWNKQGQWAFGTPTGGGGTAHGYPDPISGVTGTKVFGVNLAGDYSAASGGPFYLTAGPFSFAGRRSADLHFARWLNSDVQPSVSATIDVSIDGTTWTPVWNNGTNEIADSQWSYFDYNLSAIADFQPRVYVRWGYAIGAGAQPYSGWNIDDVALFAGLPQILPIKAVSRKTQGSGTYDIDLPLSGAAGIECRSAGAGGTHQIVVTFAAPVTLTGATVIKGTGSVSSIAGNNTDTLTVNLSGVSVAPQLIVIKLANVTDGVATSDVGIQMGILVGDTTSDRSVNSADIGQTKSQSGHAVTTSNFREDVTADGSINSADIGLVKSKSGTALPP
jgi:hypothetical protein